MRPRIPITIVSAVTGALLAVPLCAQTLSFRRCGPPSEPIGLLREGVGEVSFTPLPDGSVDTASIAVVQAQALSAAGLRSVAVRLLATCQLRAPRGGFSSAGVAVGELSYKFQEVKITKLAWRKVAPPVLPLEQFDLAETDLPVAYDRRIAEELVRPLDCSVHPGTRPSATKRPPPAPRDSIFPLATEGLRETQKASDARRAAVAASLPSHEATYIDAEMLVRADGSADPGIKLKTPLEPKLGTSIASRAVSCPYAPARYRGVAVAAWIGVIFDGNTTTYRFGGWR